VIQFRNFYLPVPYLEAKRLEYDFTCLLYGPEALLLTLREERKLEVSESKVLRRVYGPEKGLTREWKELQN
jgi:hypothetical protein